MAVATVEEVTGAAATELLLVECRSAAALICDNIALLDPF